MTAAGRPLGRLEAIQCRLDTVASAARLVRVVVFQEVIDPTHLRDAAAEVAEQHPILRAAIDPAAMTIGVVAAQPDVRLASCGDDELSTFFETELNTPYRPGECVVRFFHLAVGAASSALLVSAHHAALDGRSMSFVVRALLDALDRQRTDGGSPRVACDPERALPAPVDDFLPLGRLRRGIDYLKRQTDGNVRFDRSRHVDEAKTLCHVICAPPESATALAATAGVASTTVAGLLAASLLRATSRHLGLHEISIATTVDLRPILGVPLTHETVGFYVSGVQTVHAPSTMDRHELAAGFLRNVKQKVRSDEPLVTPDLQRAAVAAARWGVQPYDLLFTNLGRGALGEHETLTPVASFGGATAHGVGCSIACFTGTVHPTGTYVALHGNSARVSRADLAAVAHEMADDLRRWRDHAGLVAPLELVHLGERPLVGPI